MGIDYLIFGNVDSRDYGIEVFFKDVDRTPKRVYQRIEVPGRNGAILIDENRYEDVPVSYDCIALLDADRKAFVNALAAQTGYKRLQDSFNDDEFYSAVFKGDVDPNVTKDRAQSTFTVDFTRSAQRYLISGETQLTLESGDTLMNPTLFESSPLLELTGYGGIQLGDYDIEVRNIVEVLVSGEAVSTKNYGSDKRSANIAISPTRFNAGDLLLFGRVKVVATYELEPLSGYTITRVEPLTNGMAFSAYPSTDGKWIVTVQYTLEGGAALSGDTDVAVANEITLQLRAQYSNGTHQDSGSRFYVSTTWFSSSSKQNFGFHIWDDLLLTPTAATFYYEPIYADSTVPVLDSPTFIDCEYGEAYRIENGRAVSLNAYIDLGSDLPKLAVGPNTITYDNTVVSLKVHPRWWKL